MLNDLEDVERVEVVDPHTVVLHLKQENSVLPILLADRAGMMVSPAAVKKLGRPVVFKADGLAAGKGVLVCRSADDVWISFNLHADLGGALLYDLDDIRDVIESAASGNPRAQLALDVFATERLVSRANVSTLRSPWVNWHRINKRSSLARALSKASRSWSSSCSGCSGISSSHSTSATSS